LFSTISRGATSTFVGEWPLPSLSWVSSPAPGPAGPLPDGCVPCGFGIHQTLRGRRPPVCESVKLVKSPAHAIRSWASVSGCLPVIPLTR
jgi:hypothetical protein